MTVEIDVGLENAAKVKVPPAEPRKTDLTPQGLVTPKVRRLLTIGIVVLLAAVLALFPISAIAKPRMMLRLTATSPPSRPRFPAASARCSWRTIKP